MTWDEFQDETLVQGTDAWRSARNKRIGGSDIASILQISPYKTRLQLWEEKVGIRDVPNISNLPHVKRGIDAEPIARSLIERKRRIKYVTPVLRHDKYPQMVASLDGLCTQHTMEIKTMSLEKHLIIKKAMGGSVAMRNKAIPKYYMTQLQWGMMIAKKPLNVFASYRPEDNTLYELEIPEDKDSQRHMLAKALQFWRWIINNQRPTEMELDLE